MYKISNTIRNKIFAFIYPLINNFVSEKNKFLRNYITKNTSGNILEIGGGTGIMSCIASKKIGNENSIFCYEVNPILADVCRNTAKDNNCNVNVIEKISTEGNLFEINGKKDVLICETIGNFLIEEHMLTIINHAHDTFLTDNPTVIPKSGKIYGYLCSSPQQNNEFIANNSSFENIDIYIRCLLNF